MKHLKFEELAVFEEYDFGVQIVKILIWMISL